MRTWSLLSVSIALTALVAAPHPAHAQGTRAFKVDESLAGWGKRIWISKQCAGCHELGRQQSTGPDLIGVTDRRSIDWLRKWLKDPKEMTSDDSIGSALKQQYNSQMPNFGLNDHDIDGVINFLAEQTEEHTHK